MDYDNDPEPHNWAAEDWRRVANERSAEIVRLETDGAATARLLRCELATAKARIAELERAIEVWKREELAWGEREKSITRAVAELEKAKRMSPGRWVEECIDAALEALR